MIARKYLRLTMISTVLGLPMLAAAGCSEDERKAIEPGGKASAASERGGGVTSDSPGGANVTPNEGQGGVR